MRVLVDRGDCGVDGGGEWDDERMLCLSCSRWMEDNRARRSRGDRPPSSDYLFQQAKRREEKTLKD